uniref:G-protein coupled receptors family 1 profile domain-containing protein n=1 Tax=Clastoptera arizonana TaxID=38151 RepID=A0A1B6EG53_9HEMI
MTSSTSMVNLTSSNELEYDYDFTESWNYFDWKELTPALIVYTVTMVIGIIGNSLIVFTISRYRRMKSTTNVFLASLASADLLLIVVCIPVKLAKLFSYTWTMGFFLCKLVHYMQSVTAICSVLTLTAMSIERYYAIVHPMKAKYVCTISQARRVIFALWIAALLLATPILFVQVHMRVAVDKFPNTFWCVRNYDDPPIWRLHEMYMLILVLIVPTSVMAVTYTSICWEVWNVMQTRYHMTSGKASLNGDNFPLSTKRTTTFIQSNKPTSEDNNTVKQVIKMLVLIVIVFILCWGPLLIDNVLTAWGVLDSQKLGLQKYLATTFHLMAYFNSCVNPIVYGFMSKKLSGKLPDGALPMLSRASAPQKATLHVPDKDDLV